jgi:hypothetical protein
MRQHANGQLRIQGDVVQFEPNGRPSAQVSSSSIQDISLGTEDKQIGGVPMTLGKGELESLSNGACRSIKSTPGDVIIERSFRDAIYENLLEELAKTKQFKHLYRSGDRKCKGRSPPVHFEDNGASLRAGKRDQAGGNYREWSDQIERSHSVAHTRGSPGAGTCRRRQCPVHRQQPASYPQSGT